MPQTANTAIGMRFAAPAPLELLRCPMSGAELACDGDRLVARIE
jgi:hypothetical protein